MTLMLSSFDSCFVGKLQVENEERQMASSGYYISDITPDLTTWDEAGILLFVVAAGVAIAALILGRQGRKGMTIKS
jgi:hypothetical protein